MLNEFLITVRRINRVWCKRLIQDCSFKIVGSNLPIDLPRKMHFFFVSSNSPCRWRGIHSLDFTNSRGDCVAGLSGIVRENARDPRPGTTLRPAERAYLLSATTYPDRTFTRESQFVHNDSPSLTLGILLHDSVRDNSRTCAKWYWWHYGVIHGGRGNRRGTQPLKKAAAFISRRHGQSSRVLSCPIFCGDLNPLPFPSRTSVRFVRRPAGQRNYSCLAHRLPLCLLISLIRSSLLWSRLKPSSLRAIRSCFRLFSLFPLLAFLSFVISLGLNSLSARTGLHTFARGCYLFILCVFQLDNLCSALLVYAAGGI